MYFSWVSVKGNSRKSCILLHQIDTRQQRIDYCYCSSCSLMLLSGVLSGWVCKQASMLALQNKCFSTCWKIWEEIEQGVLGVWLTSLAQGLKFICLRISTCLKVRIVRTCLYSVAGTLSCNTHTLKTKASQEIQVIHLSWWLQHSDGGSWWWEPLIGEFSSSFGVKQFDYVPVQ